MKRTVFLSVILLVGCCKAFAQPKQLKDLLTALPKDPGVELVRMGLDSSVCIIKQSYTLTDEKGNEYGRNNDAVFGTTYSLGVLTGKGIYTAYDVRTPWKKDPNFEKYKKDAKLKPHLAKTYYKYAGSKILTVLDSAQAPVIRDTLYTVLSSPDSVAGVGLANKINQSTGSGWLVTLSSRAAGAGADTAKISLDISSPQISAPAAGGKMYLPHLVIKDAPIGGIYITAAGQNGKIVFSAAGILKHDDKGWYIQPFDTGGTINKIKAADSPTKKVTPAIDHINPIKG